MSVVGKACALRSVQVCRLSIAGLSVGIDARDAGVAFGIPFSHSSFLRGAGEEAPAGSEERVLSLVVSGEKPATQNWQATVLYRTQNWELWRDQSERYVFSAPRLTPPRLVTVETGFARGWVSLDRSACTPDVYPLQSLDMLLYVNWLAEYADVILHAAGVAVKGKGYAMVGSSGAGKSTLAAALAGFSGVTVLGEDQVILRYLDGRFWIYGTPWHLDPTMASPLGVPLERVLFLDRSAAEPMSAIAPMEGVARLMRTAFVPYYRPDAVDAILNRFALLSERVPFHSLAYRLGSDPLAQIRFY